MSRTFATHMRGEHPLSIGDVLDQGEHSEEEEANHYEQQEGEAHITRNLRPQLREEVHDADSSGGGGGFSADMPRSSTSSSSTPASSPAGAPASSADAADHDEGDNNEHTTRPRRRNLLSADPRSAKHRSQRRRRMTSGLPDLESSHIEVSVKLAAALTNLDNMTQDRNAIRVERDGLREELEETKIERDELRRRVEELEEQVLVLRQLGSQALVIKALIRKKKKNMGEKEEEEGRPSCTEKEDAEETNKAKHSEAKEVEEEKKETKAEEQEQEQEEDHQPGLQWPWQKSEGSTKTKGLEKQEREKNMVVNGEGEGSGLPYTEEDAYDNEAKNTIDSNEIKEQEEEGKRTKEEECRRSGGLQLPWQKPDSNVAKEEQEKKADDMEEGHNSGLQWPWQKENNKKAKKTDNSKEDKEEKEEEEKNAGVDEEESHHSGLQWPWPKQKRRSDQRRRRAASERLTADSKQDDDAVFDYNDDSDETATMKNEDVEEGMASDPMASDPTLPMFSATETAPAHAHAPEQTQNHSSTDVRATDEDNAEEVSNNAALLHESLVSLLTTDEAIDPNNTTTHNSTSTHNNMTIEEEEEDLSTDRLLQWANASEDFRTHQFLEFTGCTRRDSYSSLVMSHNVKTSVDVDDDEDDSPAAAENDGNEAAADGEDKKVLPHVSSLGNISALTGCFDDNEVAHVMCDDENNDDVTEGSSPSSPAEREKMEGALLSNGNQKDVAKNRWKFVAANRGNVVDGENDSPEAAENDDNEAAAGGEGGGILPAVSSLGNISALTGCLDENEIAHAMLCDDEDDDDVSEGSSPPSSARKGEEEEKEVLSSNDKKEGATKNRWKFVAANLTQIVAPNKNKNKNQEPSTPEKSPTGVVVSKEDDDEDEAKSNGTSAASPDNRQGEGLFRQRSMRGNLAKQGSFFNLMGRGGRGNNAADEEREEDEAMRIGAAAATEATIEDNTDGPRRRGGLSRSRSLLDLFAGDGGGSPDRCHDRRHIRSYIDDDESLAQSIDLMKYKEDEGIEEVGNSDLWKEKEPESIEDMPFQICFPSMGHSSIQVGPDGNLSSQGGWSGDLRQIPVHPPSSQ